MPPGLMTPPFQFWRKLGSLRGPQMEDPQGLAGVVGESKTGLSHQASELVDTPSAQALVLVTQGPRVQMLKVNDVWSRFGLAPGAGKFWPLQWPIRSANRTVLLVPSLICGRDIRPVPTWAL